MLLVIEGCQVNFSPLDGERVQWVVQFALNIKAADGTPTRVSSASISLSVPSAHNTTIISLALFIPGLIS